MSFGGYIKRRHVSVIMLIVSMVKVVLSCQFFESEPAREGVIVEPQPIDLGLSVLWGNCNLGTDKPYGKGFRYSWGDTTPKNDFSWDAYAYSNGNYNKLTKYCTLHEYWDGAGKMDSLYVLLPEDDAATVNLGGKWRMPTIEEFTELANKCEWDYTTINGVDGYKVSSKIEGYEDKWIFFPATGIWRDDLPDGGKLGYYWSATLNLEHPNYARYLCFKFGFSYNIAGIRYGGNHIRPVLSR